MNAKERINKIDIEAEIEMSSPSVGGRNLKKSEKRGKEEEKNIKGTRNIDREKGQKGKQ